jgi:hypothetical protein
VKTQGTRRVSKIQVELDRVGMPAHPRTVEPRTLFAGFYEFVVCVACWRGHLA